jgi:hypothetical protein
LIGLCSGKLVEIFALFYIIYGRDKFLLKIFAGALPLAGYLTLGMMELGTTL